MGKNFVDYVYVKRNHASESSPLDSINTEDKIKYWKRQKSAIQPSSFLTFVLSRAMSNEKIHCNIALSISLHIIFSCYLTELTNKITIGH